MAENEPDIESYFVRPPYYQEVTSSGSSGRTLILFGARGAGKSATRLAFFKHAWAQKENGEEVPLVITLDNDADARSGFGQVHA